MARPIVLILYLSRLASTINFRKDYSPPLVRHLDLTSGIRARSLICSLHRPERMAAYALDVECPYTFDSTHFERWKIWMTYNFKFICPQMWWIVDVGLSHVLNENNLTQAQEKCLDLDIQATNIFLSIHER